MNRTEFKAFLNLLMASDPTPVSKKEDETLKRYANRVAVTMGFRDWIHAFHTMPYQEPK